MIQRITIT